MADCSKCGGTGRLPHADKQLGLERTPEEYVKKLVEIFREVRRVLRSDGTVWLNLGDTYAASTKGNGGIGKGTLNCGPELNAISTERQTMNTQNYELGYLKVKDLVGVPWRVAFALQADGWYLRSDIIWSKPNPMPESVTDRPTKAHEYIFLLAKSARYYYDQVAIAEDAISFGEARGGGKKVSASNEHYPEGSAKQNLDVYGITPETRNRRSVWTVATQPYPDAHFATFPPALIEPCILAGCPVGGTVLDPFAGAGTTGLVALRLHRNFIGIELNPEYVEMARRRIEQDAPLFNEVEVANA